MLIKYLSMVLFFVSLFLPALSYDEQSIPGWYAVVFGPLGYLFRGFKPGWVWLSWFANVGFLVSCAPAHTEKAAHKLRLVAFASLALGLTFLGVEKFQASSAVSHNVSYYWTPVQPEPGYYVWLAALAVMAFHKRVIEPRKTVSPIEREDEEPGGSAST